MGNAVNNRHTFGEFRYFLILNNSQTSDGHTGLLTEESSEQAA